MTTSTHLAPDHCYVCGHEAHSDTTPTGGHRFWPNAAAAVEFVTEGRKQRTTYSPEAAYVAQHRPY